MASLYRPELIKQFEEQLNIKFGNSLLLQRALTHKSFANENPELNLRDNERLEFLGDSVLSLVISTYIFTHFPEYPEGELARMRAVIVSEPVLAMLSREIGVGNFLLLSRGEELSGGRKRDSILADAMEALIGALYLDKGFARVQSFLVPLFKKVITDVKEGRYIQDYKTLLQELLQKDSNGTPEYIVVGESGPDHNKTFQVSVTYKNKIMGKGQGSSKKEAEQEAARSALKKMNQL